MQMFKLLSTAYSSVYVDEAARTLGVDASETRAREQFLLVHDRFKFPSSLGVQA